MNKKVYVALLLGVFALGIACAEEYSLDISIGKSIYSPGENVTFKVILLSNGELISAPVEIKISDMSDSKIFHSSVDSNRENYFQVQNDFSSGYWKIEATYQDEVVKRFFSIGEREEVEFKIEGGKLIIKNSGNTPYTKTVQILIGEKLIVQKQYIEKNEFKEIRLVAPDGLYNIQVSDGVNSISKQEVYLVGTGNAIGALDSSLAGNQPALGSAREDEGSLFQNRNFSLAGVFIAAVFGLFILMMIEKRMRTRKAYMAREMLDLH